MPEHEGSPKTLTYKELDEPFAGWFWSDTSDPRRIVIVEDVFSAIKVARQYYTVCLCGTNISLDNIFEILKYSDNVVIALDKDATKKALEYKQKYRFICPNIQVAVLDKDLKYEPDDEIRRRVNF